MGATVIDVAREFQMRLQKLSYAIAVAYVEYRPQQHRLCLGTLLDVDDPEVEDQLAQIEINLERSFQEFPMEFSTVHLRGRDPGGFIPSEAFVFHRRAAGRAADVK